MTDTNMTDTNTTEPTCDIVRTAALLSLVGQTYHLVGHAPDRFGESVKLYTFGEVKFASSRRIVVELKGKRHLGGVDARGTQRGRVVYLTPATFMAAVAFQGKAWTPAGPVAV